MEEPICCKFVKVSQLLQERFAAGLTNAEG